MYQIKKDRLPELFAAMAKAQDLFLPVRKCDQTNYGLWSEEVQVDLDTLKTVKAKISGTISRLQSALKKIFYCLPNTAHTIYV